VVRGPRPDARSPASQFFNGARPPLRAVRLALVRRCVRVSVVRCTQRGKPPQVRVHSAWVQPCRRREQPVLAAARVLLRAVPASAMFPAE
jgi:hypothetical protein